MPVNRFRLKAALADIDAKGIEVGDIVQVSWEVDDQFGGGSRSHTGPLKVLDRNDGWFEVDPTFATPGHLRSSIVAMGTRMVKVTGEKEAEIRAQLASKSGTPDSKKATKSKKANPFIEKAKKPNPFLVKAKK